MSTYISVYMHTYIHIYSNTVGVAPSINQKKKIHRYSVTGTFTREDLFLHQSLPSYLLGWSKKISIVLPIKSLNSSKLFFFSTGFLNSLQVFCMHFFIFSTSRSIMINITPDSGCSRSRLIDLSSVSQRFDGIMCHANQITQKLLKTSTTVSNGAL